MGFDEVGEDVGASRDNREGVQMRVARVVMLLNLPHVHRRRYARELIHVSAVHTEIRVVLNAPLVALEVDDVDFIEATERREGAHVGLGERVAG